jgi:hypothetical protein
VRDTVILPRSKELPSAWFNRIESTLEGALTLKALFLSQKFLPLGKIDWSGLIAGKMYSCSSYKIARLNSVFKSFAPHLTMARDTNLKTEMPLGEVLLLPTAGIPKNGALAEPGVDTLESAIKALKQCSYSFTEEELAFVKSIYPRFPNDLWDLDADDAHEVLKMDQQELEDDETPASKGKQSSAIASAPDERSFSEAASSLLQKSKSLEKFLRENFSTEIANGSLKEEEVQALVYVLSRVSERVLEKIPKSRTPSRLYDWAVVNSTITLPYLSLQQAAKEVKFDKEFSLKTGWGFEEGTFLFPSKESIDDDETYWGKLYDLLTLMGCKVEWNARKGETVPDIGSSILAKNNYFGLVFIRLVELAKSPASATLRGGQKLSALEIAKNHVDFVVLSLIRSSDKERYSNLSLSYESTQCQRKVMVNRPTVGKGGRIETVTSTSRVGYALSEQLASYVEKQVGKTPEAEPFFRFILEILYKIVERIPKGYVLPKSYFAPASSVVRKHLRRGPEIEKKGTTKQGHTYVPFSFSKASSCSDMNETIRKSLTTAGAKISTHLDSVNNLSIALQNEIIPLALRYVEFCYNLSDELRKKWQKAGEVISEPLRFPSYFDEDPFESVEDCKKVLSKLAGLSFKTVPAMSDEIGQKALIARLNEMTIKSKQQRQAAARK